MKSVFLLPEGDRRKRSILFKLGLVNGFKDTHRLRCITICDEKPIGIVIEQVLFQGDRKQILTVVTKVKGTGVNSVGLRPNDIILPPGVSDSLPFNHFQEIQDRLDKSRSRMKPLRLNALTKKDGNEEDNKSQNDFSMTHKMPPNCQLIKTSFADDDIVYL